MALLHMFIYVLLVTKSVCSMPTFKMEPHFLKNLTNQPINNSSTKNIQKEILIEADSLRKEKKPNFPRISFEIKDIKNKTFILESFIESGKKIFSVLTDVIRKKKVSNERNKKPSGQGRSYSWEKKLMTLILDLLFGLALSIALGLTMQIFNDFVEHNFPKEHMEEDEQWGFWNLVETALVYYDNFYEFLDETLLKS